MPAASSWILSSLTGVPPLFSSLLLFPPPTGLSSLSQRCTDGNHFPQLPGPKMDGVWTVLLLCSLLAPSQGSAIQFPLTPKDVVGECMEGTGLRKERPG